MAARFPEDDTESDQSGEEEKLRPHSKAKNYTTEESQNPSFIFTQVRSCTQALTQRGTQNIFICSDEEDRLPLILKLGTTPHRKVLIIHCGDLAPTG